MAMMLKMVVVSVTLLALLLSPTLASILPPSRSLPPAASNASHRLDQSVAQQTNGATQSSFLKCVSGSSQVAGVMETTHHTSHFLVNISTDFRYLQVSMKLGSCFHYYIYRGNRFLTKESEWRQGLSSQCTMEIIYTKLTDGNHAYHLTVDSLGLRQTINTSVKCGEFNSFRVRAKGASVCELRVRENTKGIWVNHARTRTTLPQTLHDLQRWARNAYVMVICFTLTSYVLFLIAGHFKSRSEYTTVGVEERSV